MFASLFFLHTYFCPLLIIINPPSKLLHYQLPTVKNITKLQNAAQRASHWLSRCQVVLNKIPFDSCHNLSFVTTWLLELCHNFSFRPSISIWVVTIWVFEFCHNLSFEFVSCWILLQVEFCNDSIFWVFFSQFAFLSSVTIHKPLIQTDGPANQQLDV